MFDSFTCGLPWHRGNRQGYRKKVLYRDGKRWEGCPPCIEGINPSVYPWQKRWICSRGTGKWFKMSPAHRRDVELRKLAPDGRTVYRNRRGNVT